MKKIVPLLLKRWYFLTLISLFGTASFAQTELYIKYSDDTEDTFIINEDGKITFDNNNLVINQDGNTPVNIQISSLRKITFNYNNDDDVFVINNSTSTNNIAIYPNPANDYITIEYPNKKNISVQIFSLSGQVVFQKNINSDKQINISSLQSGLYIIKIDEKTLKFSKL